MIQERYPDYKVNPDQVSRGIWLNSNILWKDEEFQQITTGRIYMQEGSIIAMHSDKDIPRIEFVEFIKETPVEESSTEDVEEVEVEAVAVEVEAVNVEAAPIIQPPIITMSSIK